MPREGIKKMSRIVYYLNKIKTQKRPIRFLLSRLLWYSRLCRFLKIHLPYGVVIVFYPTSLSAALWENRNDRKFDIDFIYYCLPEEGTFIDVGANIGVLSLIAAKKVGEKGKVISIEPHPRIFSFLSKNVELNKFNKCIYLRNVAIGDKAGEAFFSSIKSDDQNKIMSNRNATIKVPVKKLDDMIDFNVIERISLLKVDTEGYEKFVFEGAHKTLKITECIYFESWETHFNNYGYSTKDVINLLSKYEFKIYKLKDGNLFEIERGYISKKCENLIAIREPSVLNKIVVFLRGYGNDL